MLEVSTVLNWEYVEYAVAFFIVVLALLIARICVYIFEKYLEHFASKTESKLDDMIIEAIKRPVYLLTILIGVYFALNSIEFQYMNDAVIFFKIFGISLTTWVVYSLTDAIIKEYGYALAERTESDIDDVIIPVIDQIAGILIIVLGILSILNLLGIKITPILAGMGVAGIAVALAAQETLSNMFSGFTLMMDRPFKIGDRIVLDSGELCEVRDIGLRSTRLYDVIDHAMITMPNSDVSNMKITNISMPDVKLKIRVPIGVAYGTDIELVKKILLEIAEEAPEVLNDPQPDVFFVDFGDSSLNFLLISWIGNVRRKMEVIDYINCKIKNRFEEEGIDIPFPIRTIYMQS